MIKKAFRRISVVLTMYLIITLVSPTLSTCATSQKYQDTLEPNNVSSTGTISVVLRGRLLGMPGTKVRCQAVDGINDYDCTKTVMCSGTRIPYYLTCFVYLPLPGEYKLTADPVIPGFRGSSKTVEVYSPAVVEVELYIRVGIKACSSNLHIFTKFLERFPIMSALLTLA